HQEGKQDADADPWSGFCSGEAESNDERARHAQEIDADPDIAGLARPNVVCEISCENQRPPQDDHLARDVVGARPSDAAHDVVDIAERPRCLSRIDTGHDPMPPLATSSATTVTALGEPTTPM